MQNVPAPLRGKNGPGNQRGKQSQDLSRCVESIQVKLVDSTAELQQKAACQINNSSSREYLLKIQSNRLWLKLAQSIFCYSCQRRETRM